MAESAERSGGERRQRPLLTEAELRVFVALEDLLDELGHAPTHMQIAARIGWSSRGSVNLYLKRLTQKGVVEGKGRSLRVVK